MVQSLRGGVRFPVLVAGLFVIGTLLAAPSMADDDDDFGNESIKGRWGFSASGILMPPAVPSQTPAAAVGLIEFDGQGGCRFTDQINIGGTAIPSTGFRRSTECSYAVNLDGTGLLSVEFPEDPVPTPLTFVIVEEAEEIRFIRTDVGVASGVAKRQNDDELND